MGEFVYVYLCVIIIVIFVIIMWLKVFCIMCFDVVFNVLVVLFKSKIVGFFSIVWVMVICCFCLFELDFLFFSICVVNYW